MSQLYLILRNLRDNGPGTSAEIALSVNLPPKRVSTLLSRMADYNMVKRGEKVPEKRRGPRHYIWLPLI